jgi:trehalose 6-phosphate phosphatase
VQPAVGETEAIERFLGPLTDHPEKAVILCDLDGTLAEIVARPELTRITDGVRVALARIADRYAQTAVVTGRRATVARSIIGIQKLTYIGNHGFELLLPGAPDSRAAPELGGMGELARRFANGLDEADLGRTGLRVEDKGPIVAIHWRGVTDEAAAEEAAATIAADAESRGLVVHRGRKVLELRPPIDVDKGSAAESLLLGTAATAAFYAGDDLTDLDAFRALDRLRASGRLAVAVKVGVASAEGPEEIAAESDLSVAGPAGLLPVLRFLAG